ncbi:MAG: BlaI/MecI/CopY family transcriptional regulator [Verrucomicrobia bacterium]|nr:BlaI/MecI/CopY family transcriptional regulator [Verrucomicrobiota bacterium]
MPKISDAEWVVMKALWEKAPLTTNQVVQALASKAPWKPKTIHTLLARLVEKGALVCDRTEREYSFRPSVEAKDCLRAATRSFLSRFFDGEVAPFLACFLKNEKLSSEEIEQLKRILEDNQP